MKPSKHAIEAAMLSYQGLYVNHAVISAILKAAYAIDVDPLLASLQKQCDMLHRTNEEMALGLAEKDKEIERLEGEMMMIAPPHLKKHISELEAENARLKADINDVVERHTLRAATPDQTRI